MISTVADIAPGCPPSGTRPQNVYYAPIAEIPAAALTYRMPDPTPTWTYVQAWERAAKALHVEIDGPTSVKISPTVVLEAEMLVRGFGAPRGTLVFRYTDQYPPYFGLLRERGLTASSFGPYRYGVECDLADMVDVLGDWGWCGVGPDPPWLLTIDADGWSAPSDFYETVLPKLRAPQWHGRNLDALWDSIARSGTNDLQPPFAMRIFNTERLSPEMTAFMEKVETLFRDASEAGVPVALHVWP
jgi:RNAse (barnase) inhibitor barstar